MKQVCMMAQEPTIAHGLLNRVRREVFAAAVEPKSEERDARLAYWHARQRSIERITNLNGLFRPYYMKPIGKLTKVERAMVREDALTPPWRPCPAELAAGA